MNEIMRDEILDQPSAVEHCLPILRDQAKNAAAHITRSGRLIMAGSGDSYFAGLALQSALRARTAAEVHAITALDAARYWSYRPGDVLIAISISGESARVLEAANAATAAGAHLLAISSNGESSLARLSPTPLVIPFRSRSRATPHTTDYMTTLLALAVLAETCAGRRESFLDALPSLVDKTVTGLEAPSCALAERMAAAETIFFLGAGPNVGTAQYAAAKFWEAGGLRAAAFDLEEFGHGPHLQVDAGDAVCVLAPTGQIVDRASAIARGLAQIHAACIRIGDTKTTTSADLTVSWVDEDWSPLLLCIPLQWLTWAVTTVKGCDVLSKDYRHANAKDYETVHWQLVRTP